MRVIIYKNINIVTKQRFDETFWWFVWYDIRWILQCVTSSIIWASDVNNSPK